MPIIGRDEGGSAVRAVLKVGGSILDGPRDNIPVWFQELQEWRATGRPAVIVHGGGPRISQALQDLGENVEFVHGQRVTTPKALDVVVQVLRGAVNTELVAALNARGVPAIGLSGVDGGLLHAVPWPDLGSVGQIVGVSGAVLEALWSGGWVPVVAPLAGDGQGGILNCNGDFAASAIAAAIRAQVLVFYTDTGGVRRQADDPGTIVDRMRRQDIEEWIESGQASGGMIPKLRAAAAALDGGVAEVVIGRLSVSPGQATVITR